jgi:hypothetical protein
MGNEGYFGEDWINPPTMNKWVSTIVASIKAMKAVDPSIKIGVPIHTAAAPNGSPWMYYPYVAGGGWIPMVLANITKQVNIDFVTTHNAYLPYNELGPVNGNTI